MRLTQQCPSCSQIAILVDSIPISPTEELRTLKCGHAFVVPIDQALPEKELNYCSALDNKTARDYQKEGIQFILGTGQYEDYRRLRGQSCIIADQMRLGKTPQALLAFANSGKKKCLTIVRAANIWQWVQEDKTWVNPLPLSIYPIFGSKSFIPPGFQMYIISMDTFSKAGMVDKLLKQGFDLVICDEAHGFKNASSKRTQALVQFLSDISQAEMTYEIPFICTNCKETWTEEVTKKINTAMQQKYETVSKEAYCPRCNAFNRHSSHKESTKIERKCDIVLLTGTPIKNRANEYYVPLNLVAPDRFPSRERFEREWIDPNDNKKSRLNPKRVEAFRELVRPYVLRREKEDVYTDLPPINRIFTLIEIEDESLRDLYNQRLKLLEADMVENPNLTFFESIGHLQILRQICGLSKVKWAAEYLEDAIEDSENGRYIVGIHHKLVREGLARSLSHLGTLQLSGEDGPDQKYRIMKNFEHSRERILICNMLAGGIGMDFHYCDNELILERQWSSADEEQFEFRIYNPDKSIKNTSSTIEYALARGTIDEWFHDLVESKRKIFGQTVSNNWDMTQDPGSWRELLQQTVDSKLLV